MSYGAMRFFIFQERFWSCVWQVTYITHGTSHMVHHAWYMLITEGIRVVLTNKNFFRNSNDTDERSIEEDTAKDFDLDEKNRASVLLREYFFQNSVLF